MMYNNNKNNIITVMPFLKTQLDPQTDIAFRCPLGPQLSSMISSVDSPSNNNNSNNNNIQPLLYRMYIACHILKFNIETRFTALVFLHRYNIATKTNTTISSNNSNNEKQQQLQIKKTNLEWVAAACLFLASKAEEEPRRLRDVINLAQMLLSTTTTNTDNSTKNNINNINHINITSSETTNTTNTINNCIQIQQTPPDLNQGYWDCKKHIVETEQDVLRWLGYDTSVSHPHRLVLLLLENCPQSQSQRTLTQIAYRRLNDALFCQFALQHPILELSIAAIELAIEEIEIMKTTATTATATTMIMAEQNGSSNNNNNSGEENNFNFASAAYDKKKIKSILYGHYKRYNLSQSKVMKAKTDLENATRILKQQQKQQQQISKGNNQL